MNALIRKLNYIAEDCGMQYVEMQENSEPEVPKAEQTPFNLKRRDMNILLKETRKAIEDRAAEEQKPECDKVEVVKMSTEIRKKIKEIQALGAEMQALHDKDVTKNKKKRNAKVEERLQLEEQVLQAIKQHYDQIVQMDRERSGVGDVRGAMPTITGLEKYKVDTLPDIEDDERFAQIRRNDQEIDAQLDIIAAGAKDLKGIATEIGEKIDVQKDKLDTLDSKVDKVNERFDSTNAKLTSVLNKVKGPDKCLMIVMMAFILLAVLSLIGMILAKVLL